MNLNLDLAKTFLVLISWNKKVLQLSLLSFLSSHCSEVEQNDTYAKKKKKMGLILQRQFFFQTIQMNYISSRFKIQEKQGGNDTNIFDVEIVAIIEKILDKN